MTYSFRSGGVIATAGLALLATGCANITGLDGKSSYSCKAPDGVKCDSVSGNYYNSVQNNLPSQRRSPTSNGGAETPASAPTPPETSYLVSTAPPPAAAAQPVPYKPAPPPAAPRR